MIEELIGKVIHIEDMANDTTYYDYIVDFADEKYCIFRMAIELGRMTNTILIDNMHASMRYPPETPYETMLSGKYPEYVRFRYITEKHTIALIQEAHRKFQLIEIVEK